MSRLQKMAVPGAILIMMVFAGCFSRQIVEYDPMYYPCPDETTAMIRHEISQWRNVPYRYGGNDKSGIDCSAFVQYLYGKIFEIPLPRDTKTQVRMGRYIEKERLQPGDLVFFRPRFRTYHVGLYLCNGEFAHVSQNVGVTVSRLNNPYWEDAYWTSRRVFEYR